MKTIRNLKASLDGEIIQIEAQADDGTAVEFGLPLNEFMALHLQVGNLNDPQSKTSPLRPYRRTALEPSKVRISSETLSRVPLLIFDIDGSFGEVPIKISRQNLLALAQSIFQFLQNPEDAPRAN